MKQNGYLSGKKMTGVCVGGGGGGGRRRVEGYSFANAVLASPS